MNTIQNQETIVPRRRTKEGVIAFLSSSAVAGIGKVFAKRLVDKYGTGVVEKIKDEPESVVGVAGVGESRLKEASENLRHYHRPLDLELLLYSCGISEIFIDRVFGKYKSRASAIISEDPYSMVEDVWRLSFFTADKIGRFISIPENDKRRLRGALVTAVKHYAENGHLYTTKEDAIKFASRITGVSEKEVEQQVQPLIDSGRLINDKGCLYLPVFYKAEIKVAKALIEKLSGMSETIDADLIPSHDISGHEYTTNQREAIKLALESPVMVLTGGPGSGKTTVLKGILDVFEKNDKKLVLVAPTGRAAKRMSTLTGREASTIHRLLGFRQGEGYRIKKIDADVIIIDEGSMLEQVMFMHLLDAVKPETKLIIVGDVDQLPSIGAGNVLQDIINSEKVPAITLTENFRQARGSLIAEGARMINRGEYPVFDETRNFFFVEANTESQIRDKIIELVSSYLPKKLGINPIDIHVVTPQQIGALGVRQLNEDMQRHLNPTGPFIRRGETVLRLGDPVLQTINSSQRGVYNGEIGVVSGVDEATNSLIVKFRDGRVSEYKGKEIGELTLAYATSVHKLQGSEIEYMVMPLTMDHRPMLYRNLIYTAVSRAKSLCVLVGEHKALKYAIANDISNSRNSNLKYRL